jgi:7-cyano-7-deazaguanine synthase
MARRLGDACGEPGGGQKLVDLIVEHTHTCYLGDRSQRHAWGYGCGHCPACDLRAKGHESFMKRPQVWGRTDPLMLG